MGIIESELKTLYAGGSISSFPIDLGLLEFQATDKSDVGVYKLDVKFSYKQDDTHSYEIARYKFKLTLLEHEPNTPPFFQTLLRDFDVLSESSIDIDIPTVWDKEGDEYEFKLEMLNKASSDFVTVDSKLEKINVSPTKRVQAGKYKVKLIAFEKKDTTQ